MTNKKIKICKRCNQPKGIDNFTKHVTNSDRRNNFCRDCMTEKTREYRQNNRDKLRVNEIKYDTNNHHIRKEYRKKNKEKIFEYQKAYADENKEKISKRRKNWKEKNKDIIKKKNKEYELKNKDKIATRKKTYAENNKEKIAKRLKNYKSRPDIKTKNRIRDNFISSFKRQCIKKTDLFFSYTKISYSKYINHLKKDPLWDDYLNNKNIHIDHIIPVSAYDFNNLEEIKKCWHPDNLRFLPAKENISKKNKIDINLIEKHNIVHLLPGYII